MTADDMLGCHRCDHEIGDADAAPLYALVRAHHMSEAISARQRPPMLLTLDDYRRHMPDLVAHLRTPVDFEREIAHPLLSACLREPAFFDALAHRSPHFPAPDWYMGVPVPEVETLQALHDAAFDLNQDLREVMTPQHQRTTLGALMLPTPDSWARLRDVVELLVSAKADDILEKWAGNVVNMLRPIPVYLVQRMSLAPDSDTVNRARQNEMLFGPPAHSS
jgi:hypothetical protein